MAGIDRTDPVILGHILAQHRELFDQITTIRGCLAAPWEAGATAAGEAAAALRSLREHLAGHFRQEECGGFLEESIARMPRLSRAMQAVIGEHPGLLAELDGLIETVGVADISPLAWGQAARDFEAFAAHLLAHERNEHAVVQEGYNEDLGLVE
jgi:hypothetical protein